MNVLSFVVDPEKYSYGGIVFLMGPDIPLPAGGKGVSRKWAGDERGVRTGLIDEDPAVADAAGGTLLGTRQIIEGGDSLLAAEVDDQQMGEVIAGDGLPEG